MMAVMMMTLSSAPDSGLLVRRPSSGTETETEGLLLGPNPTLTLPPTLTPKLQPS